MGQDLYKLLDVDPGAGPAEIKKAFRAKVKRIHPDLNPGGAEASRRMQDLVRAYETLINPVLRDEYDQASRHHRGAAPFDYRSFLKEQGDPVSLSKLIFYDLLHGLEPEAVAVYLGLRHQEGYALSSCFDREDFMDCAYILAEELVVADEPEAGFELFFQISQMELKKPYFRFFFVEVVMHLRHLLQVTLPARLPIERVIIYLEKTIQLGLGPKDTAFFMKCAAESYLKRNQRPRALFYYQECLRLDARASGLKELRRKLHVI
jgi:curved DNA-binding protein CbpA